MRQNKGLRRCENDQIQIYQENDKLSQTLNTKLLGQT